MDRINELIAKGIDTLTTDELTELRDLLHKESDDLLDAEPSDEVLQALEEIAANLDAVKAEVNKRETAAAERAAKARELADRIRADAATEDGDGGDDGEPAAESADATAGDTADETVATEEGVPAAAAAAVEPVAAASTPIAKPIVTRVAARRPKSTAPKVETVQAAIVASANVPGVQAGAALDTEGKLAEAFMAAVEATTSYRGGGQLKVPVAQLRVDLPGDRMLGRDPYLNEQRIKAVTSPEALVASGGVCAPVPYRYDLPVVGTDARPVRDGLGRFGAQRGGVRTLIPPTIEDVTGAISTWTMANDENPSSPATKPYLTIGCDESESQTDVYAVTQSVKLGNFRQKWNPEQVAAYMSLIGTWQARYAEAKFLKGLADGSTVVSHGQVLGTARDVFTALRQLIATQRYRLRAPRSLPIRVVCPDWLRDNIIIDLIRTDSGGGTVEERLVKAESTVDSFFRALNTNVTWHLDYEAGKAIGAAGGPLAGAQGTGPVIGWPDKVRVYVFIEGSWLFLDGGTLDLGVIRDSTLVSTNDLLMFSETMENVHYHGVPGESFAYDINICANGGYASALDIDPCVSGS